MLIYASWQIISQIYEQGPLAKFLCSARVDEPKILGYVGTHLWMNNNTSQIYFIQYKSTCVNRIINIH